jgi:hypothetical protein
MVKVRHSWKALCFTLFVTITAGCTSMRANREHGPCYDGWIVNQYGESSIWIPSDAEKGKIMAQLDPNRVIQCYHSVPQKMILVVNHNKDFLFVTSFKRNGNEFEYVDEEFIVSNQ